MLATCACVSPMTASSPIQSAGPSATRLQPSYPPGMLDRSSSRRLDEASRAARAAEAAGEDATAGEAWRIYRLIRDAACDPNELLADGIALSACAIESATPSRMP